MKIIGTCGPQLTQVPIYYFTKGFMIMKKDEFNQLIAKEKELDEKYGYHIHCVCDAQPVNYHTHGLMESCSHPELEIKLSCGKESEQGDFCWSTLEILADMIVHNHFVCEFDNCLRLPITSPRDLRSVVFRPGKDMFGAPVIRVIIPDITGCYPWDPNCIEAYKEQWNPDEK